MKRIIKKNSHSKLMVLILALFFTFCSSPVESDASNSSDADLEKILESMHIEDLSQPEIEGLVFMREEEKLARDIYIKMFEKWDIKVFNNISNSEQKHMDAIKILLERHSIEDPITIDEIGVFQNSELQKLYNELLAVGNESIIFALETGAKIEEIDILDLEEQINNIADNEDLLLVYNNLLRGSRNHLRAFVRNLSSRNETYTPQQLSQEVFELIINGEMERGGKGKGKRKGNKKGRG